MQLAGLLKEDINPYEDQNMDIDSLDKESQEFDIIESAIYLTLNSWDMHIQNAIDTVEGDIKEYLKSNFSKEGYIESIREDINFIISDGDYDDLDMDYLDKLKGEPLVSYLDKHNLYPDKLH